MIKTKLENWIKEILQLEKVVLEHPADFKRGDFTLILPDSNVTRLPDGQGGGEGVIDKLNKNKIPEIEKIELVNTRFINIFLKKEFFADEISKIDGNYGKSGLLKGKNFFIEHTQPNPFKEFHIGHLMNNAIGESIVRIVRENGAEVKTCTYHGDVGLHIAKAIWALIYQSATLKDAYALGHKAYEEDEGVRKEIVEINKKIYDKSDESINKLYENGRNESLEFFDSIYSRLNNNFDFHFYESEAGEKGKKLVLDNVGKVFDESEGAVIFRGENFEPRTHTRVFLNKEGLPTYEAKEVGLAEIKKEKFDYDESVTITANEQDSFFDVVEVAIGEVFPDRKGKLKHLSHGLLKLPTGKMSSRTGDVITAESLMAQVKEKVFEKIQERGLSENEKEEIAEMVSIGAIKFSILRQAIGGDIIFDFDKSISFEGDSGPYLQYAAVRAKSVLDKSEAQSTKNETNPKFEIQKWETTDLERVLYRFPEIVEVAYKEYAPHKIVSYLLDLASKFNSFYAVEKIIDPDDPASPYKLALTQAVVTVLTNGLYLLGIKVPERM